MDNWIPGNPTICPPMDPTGKWMPGNPTINRTWDHQLLEWGVPFDYGHDHLLLPRKLDGRALDAAMRTPVFDEEGIERRTRRVRATFEYARRNEPFLDALEITLVAHLYGDLSRDAVTRFIDGQLQEPYELLWCRNLQVEEAMASVVALVRNFVTHHPEDSITSAMNIALARLDAVAEWRSPLHDVHDVMAKNP